MKDNDKRQLHDEFTGDPRSTEYEVQFYIDNYDGIELFETLHTDSPPLIPDEGDRMSVEWFEDDDENQVHDPIAPDEIGTDEQYTSKTSQRIPVDEVTTEYSKRNVRTETGDVVERVIIQKTVILNPYN